MAYDGMYGDLSTRGTTNEVLNLVLQAKDDAEDAAESALSSEATAVNAAAAALFSETSAAASSASASASASSAAASAIAAAATVSDLNVDIARFLDPSATNPVLRDNGSPLQTGDTYYNTVALENRVYNGTIWVAEGVSGTTLANAIATREPVITGTTSADYWRGDKTFQPLNKAAVGLANVDNTSDANKPVSTATQTALNLKMTSTTLAGTTGASLVGRPVSGTVADIFTATTVLGSKLIPYVPSGTGAVNTTVQDRLALSKYTTDYSSLANGLAASPNTVLEDTAGITYKNAFNQDLSVFAETLDPTWKGGTVHRAAGTGTHVGVARAAVSIENRPTGSGANGPTNADYAHSISNIKSNWFGTTQGGEIDGQNITVRQGGRMGAGIQSDCAGTLYNVGIVHGSGWAAAIEAQTSTFDTTTAALVYSLQTAMGVLDSVTSNYYGFTAVANNGVMSAAYYAGLGPGGGTFTNFLQYLGPSNIELFKVNGQGHIVLRQTGGGAAQTKTIRAIGGNLSILNDAGTVNIMTLSDTGAMNVGGNVDAGGCLISRAVAPNIGATGIAWGGTTSPTANPGGGAALPANVQGFAIINVQGTQCKVPFYAN